MEKKEYIAPTLTVVTFKVERGYALSNGRGYGSQNSFLSLIGLETDMMVMESYNSQGQQNWHESDYFGDEW